MFFDTRQRLVACNISVARLMQRRQRALLGKTFHTLFPTTADELSDTYAIQLEARPHQFHMHQLSYVGSVLGTQVWLLTDIQTAFQGTVGAHIEQTDHRFQRLYEHMHNHVQQTCLATRLYLYSVADCLLDHPNEPASLALDKSIGAVNKSLSSLRVLMDTMVHATVADASDSLQELIDRFRQLPHVLILYEKAQLQAIPPAYVKLLAYVLQEGLQNAIKHNPPTNDTPLEVFIFSWSDDGIFNFDIVHQQVIPAPAPNPRGFGLKDLELRCEAKRGTSKFAISPEGEVRLSIQLPFPV